MTDRVIQCCFFTVGFVVKKPVRLVAFFLLLSVFLGESLDTAVGLWVEK